jgi:16S rRNA pseudouridine516 synthase
VYDLLPERWRARSPPVATVGRLDKDTTGARAREGLAPCPSARPLLTRHARAPGALLLTDLGELVQRWTSPRRKVRPRSRARARAPGRRRAPPLTRPRAARAQVPKLYEAELDAALPAGAAAAFAGGAIVLDGAPCAPAALAPTGARSAAVTLTEGRYHQVKRMFASQARVLRSFALVGTFASFLLVFAGRFLIQRPQRLPRLQRRRGAP